MRDPGIGDSRPQALGSCRQVLERVEAQDDEELLAAEAIDRVLGANGVLDRGDDGLEGRVAGEMAELVVDALEVIEIEHDESVAVMESVHAGPGRAEVLAQSKAVAGTGQRIHPRRFLEGVVDARELGHIRVGSAMERLDLLQLGVIPDLGALQQDVTGQARGDRDDADDDQVAAVHDAEDGLGPNMR